MFTWDVHVDHMYDVTISSPNCSWPCSQATTSISLRLALWHWDGSWLLPGRWLLLGVITIERCLERTRVPLSEYASHTIENIRERTCTIIYRLRLSSLKSRSACSLTFFRLWAFCGWVSVSLLCKCEGTRKLCFFLVHIPIAVEVPANIFKIYCSTATRVVCKISLTSRSGRTPRITGWIT